MHTRKQIVPQVEAVESRSLMSGVSMAESLAGHLQGPAVHRRGTPDEGLIYKLQGLGRLDALGPVHVKGEVNTSFITGRFIGLVTFANRFGSVEIEVENSFTPRDDFAYIVRSASGRYADMLDDEGTLNLAIRRQGTQARFRMDIDPPQ